jgi:DNA-binding transcriptional LysR family regulator
MQVSRSNQLGLELRHLATLDAIARHRSFNRAADELGYTPSAVSQQVVAIERVVGARVFERSRGPRPIDLTEPGRVLLGHARAVLARMEAAATDVGAFTQGAAGELRIGTYQSIAARLLPSLLAEFRTAWPRIELTLHESGSHDELDGMVERGVLELAFTVAYEEGDGATTHIPLLSDPYVLVLPAGSTLGQPTLADLGQLDLVAYRECRANAVVERHLRAHGIEPRVVLRAEDNALLRRLAGTGIGAAIMPVLALDPPLDGVELRRLDGLIPDRRIGLVLHRDRFHPPAARAFVDLALAHAARLADELCTCPVGTAHSPA